MKRLIIAGNILVIAILIFIGTLLSLPGYGGDPSFSHWNEMPMFAFLVLIIVNLFFLAGWILEQDDTETKYILMINGVSDIRDIPPFESSEAEELDQEIMSRRKNMQTVVVYKARMRKLNK